MAKIRSGRKKGRSQPRRFYRCGRGWYLVDAGRQAPMLREDGSHIKEEDADEREVREAHARWLLAKPQLIAVYRSWKSVRHTWPMPRPHWR